MASEAISDSMKPLQAAHVLQHLALALLISCTHSQQVTLGDKTYLVEIRDRKMNWYAANNFCATKGMHLLSIENLDQRNVLYIYLLYKDLLGRYYWTSGNDLAESGKWVWGYNGQPFSFENWNPGEPNNYHKFEHCVQTWRNNLKLNDILCDDGSTDTICEKYNDR